jgi:hypothetical protein
MAGAERQRGHQRGWRCSESPEVHLNILLVLAHPGIKRAAQVITSRQLRSSPVLSRLRVGQQCRPAVHRTGRAGKRCPVASEQPDVRHLPPLAGLDGGGGAKCRLGMPSLAATQSHAGGALARVPVLADASRWASLHGRAALRLQMLRWAAASTTGWIISTGSPCSRVRVATPGPGTHKLQCGTLQARQPRRWCGVVLGTHMS